MKKTLASASIALFISLALAPMAMAEEKSPYTSFEEKFGYAIGVEVGQTLKSNSLELSLDALIKGVSDGYNGTPLTLSTEEIDAIKAEAVQKIRAKAQAQRIKDASSNLEKGEAFLAENMKKEGVKTTDSGLQYEVIQAGKGTPPKGTDQVKVHYKGTLMDGTEFDSSYKRLKPATFQVTGVIKGWTEALQMMSPGAKWKLTIPTDLAYGEKGAGNAIGPNEVLIFEVELLEILPTETAEKE